jgi:cell wall-associated NlpC family hydrolase
MRLLLILSILLLSACAAPMPREGDVDIVAPDNATVSSSELTDYAQSLLGVPYYYGGSDPDRGFDCSGFVGHVYDHMAGIKLPRNSSQISQHGRFVYRTELRNGDLVFFNTLRRKYSHVGIYLGNGNFIHSPSSGGSVRIDEMSNPYWERNYNGGRRIIE